MANSYTVNVVNCCHQFLEVLACVHFLQSLVLYDDLKELSVLCKLHDQIQVLVSFYNFIELHHIGVMDLFENFDFSRNSLNILLFLNFRFFKHLDCNLSVFNEFKSYLLPSEYMSAEFDLAKSALAE